VCIRRQQFLQAGLYSCRLLQKLLENVYIWHIVSHKIYYKLQLIGPNHNKWKIIFYAINPTTSCSKYYTNSTNSKELCLNIIEVNQHRINDRFQWQNTTSKQIHMVKSWNLHDNEIWTHLISFPYLRWANISSLLEMNNTPTKEKDQWLHYASCINAFAH